VLAPKSKKGLRLWPALGLLALAVASILWIRSHADWPFQERNIWTLSLILVTAILLLIWWVAFSRAAWRKRLWVGGVAVLTATLCALLFRVRGFSGDLVPILDFRWGRVVSGPVLEHSVEVPLFTARESDFPQFLGPHRNAQLEGPELDPNWSEHPPRMLWRETIGSAWSGWSIVGTYGFTQEQQGEEECSTCYEISTGRPLWRHAETAHYQNVLAGDGPRCTPTVASNRVFTLGATGILNCLEMTNGTRLWGRNIAEDAQTKVPEWGFAGSPLVYDGTVVVSAGGHEGRSLLAYRIDTGELAWSAGNRSASYSSPVLTPLCGARQVLVFNSRFITAHEAGSGKVLWEYPWGNGQPQAAVPVIVDTNRVLFSSGYGVGSELLEIRREGATNFAASRVWRSRQMKAKFANLVQQDGHLYGLDDGVLACLDLKDGSLSWKQGRYGHGQGLLVGDLFLLMAENGELVLLSLSSSGAKEIQRFRVFHNKTWNPIALSGDFLLVRNDLEAACLRLPLRTSRATAFRAQSGTTAED
jgi:outer membrane protein assembly factor BamB